MQKHTRILLSTCIFCIFIAAPAYANIGLPMIFVTLPQMLVALAPVIFLEAWVLSKHIGVPFKRSVKISSGANIISTLAGIPLTWLLLVLIQMVTGGGGAHGVEMPMQKFLAVTWQGAWLIPYESEFYWMVPAASLFLLVPFFFGSWLIEYFVAKRSLRAFERAAVKAAVFSANVCSYGILFVITLGWLVISVMRHSSS